MFLSMENGNKRIYNTKGDEINNMAKSKKKDKKMKKSKGTIKNYKELILKHPMKEITKVLFELKDEIGEEEWGQIPERVRVNQIHERLTA